MSDIDTNDYVGRFEFVEFGYNVPEGDFARFVVMFIKMLLKTFEVENEMFPSSKPGRKPYALHKMASLVYYSYARGLTKASLIADMAKNHTYFKFVANGIEPDEDTINNFINIWGSFFEYTLSYSTQLALIAGFTTFENTCADSTFAKSNNNKFNVVHKDDVKILIDYYSNKLIDINKLEGLRLPARKFLNREDLSNKDKLKYLNKIMKRFDETKANTIPVNDIDSIHLYNKDGISDVGYNIQTAVDCESKMFVALIVSQKATDHHQFPDIMNKSIENMGVFPRFACADAGYNTRRTLEYVEEIGLNALIDNNRSAKLRNGHSNDNKFHKDNMDYNIQEDYFTCYNHEKLFYQETKIKWDEKKQDYDIQRKYYNKKACSNCKYSTECCKTNYRTVSIPGGILALKMMLKFEEYENVVAYTKRFSTVEAPNGTLKIHYHINELLTPNITKSQNRINICGGSYNLIRLYNQFMELEGINESNILENVKKLCEKTNAMMPIYRNKTFLFLEEKLELPYICESCLSSKLLENESSTVQITLFEEIN